MGRTRQRVQPLTPIYRPAQSSRARAALPSSGSGRVSGAIFLPDHALPASRCHQQKRVSIFPTPAVSLMPMLALAPHTGASHGHANALLTSGFYSGASCVWDGAGTGGKGKTTHLSSNTDFIA